ncbi:hypothetical protein AB0L74_25370 [Streptomyces sp. NPDC052020]|uniref:hypothetical protein n=1 Tax=Streptomyces sp. NPDC052020 TaxID=3155677 RepID=UPI00343D9554
MTSVLLLAICLLSGHAAPTIALVAPLGLFGLGANPVLISPGVRFPGRAPTLGSALTVSAFNSAPPRAPGSPGSPSPEGYQAMDERPAAKVPLTL